MRLELQEWNESLLDLGESFSSMDSARPPPEGGASPAEESVATPHVRESLFPVRCFPDQD